MKKMFKKKYAHIRFFIFYNFVLVCSMHNGSFENLLGLFKDLLLILLGSCCIAMLYYGLIETILSDQDNND